MEIAGNLQTALLASDKFWTNSHGSSQTEMKLFTESFLNMVERPSAVTSRVHPPANEQVRPWVEAVTVRDLLRVDEILA